jgi:hypothetical protein
MIDEKGLVLCSNSRLGGAFGVTRRLYGASSSGVTIVPTEIKVIVGDAAEGIDAKFVARDTELDLAWIQIKGPGDRKFAFVDLTRSAAPKVGQKLLSVYRTSKNYDRVPVIMDSLVGGIIRKPREFYRAGDLSAALGLPAFLPDGRAAGVSVLQIPESDDESNAQLVMLDRMINAQEYSGVLRPVSEVIKATARARESAATQTASDESPDDQSTTRPAASEKKTDEEKKPSKKE